MCIFSDFRHKFGMVEHMKRLEPNVGDVIAIKENISYEIESRKISENTRFIYNLCTKEKFYEKPTYQDLEKTLRTMKTHMEKNNVTKLAIPRIGCGLDKLYLPIVKNMLTRVFKNYDGDILIKICYI